MINNQDIAISIVNNIFRLLNGRGGFDHWWHDIDEECQQEILAACRKIAIKEIEKLNEQPT